ncbi:hypothetical protein GDO81_028054 [Engystomops pustulosus]|uniref:Uncharacterized protein n=1 Tax=Engystomops pustulosus TaxID=76066 RepID=A0AAV6YNS2_ENGPU|nr:hypothetical protein GDO81_028054 [Engystomops pustulosus]
MTTVLYKVCRQCYPPDRHPVSTGSKQSWENMQHGLHALFFGLKMCNVEGGLNNSILASVYWVMYTKQISHVTTIGLYFTGDI